MSRKDTRQRVKLPLNFGNSILGNKLLNTVDGLEASDFTDDGGNISEFIL